MFLFLNARELFATREVFDLPVALQKCVFPADTAWVFLSRFNTRGICSDQDPHSLCDL